ncbi:hypothetical protein ACHAWF_005619 [Thalassiosira exigua]
MCGPAASSQNDLHINGTKVNGHSINGDSASGHVVNGQHSSRKKQPSALRRMAPMILWGYAFDTLFYFFVIHALLPRDLSPLPQYCPADNPGCTRRDLFAFQVVSFLNLSYLGFTGFHCFFVSKRARTILPRTPQGRYLGHATGKGALLPEADRINAAIVLFQGWDFFVSLFFEEHCTAIMMTHHALAFACGFGCLYYEVSQIANQKCTERPRTTDVFDLSLLDIVYIGGVCEFSSIFLSISHLFEFYSPSDILGPSSSLLPVLPAVITFSQAMFVITFFLFRIVGWALEARRLFSDATYLLKNGLIERYAPGSGWFLWYLMTTAGLLGALQVYWFGEIVQKVMEILDG